MKKLILGLGLFFAFGTVASAQTYTTDAPYVKDSVLPNFKVTLLNNKPIDIKNTFQGKPLVLIYFSPDCGHCQEMAALLSRKLDQFNSVNFVYTFYNFPMEEVAKFSESYGLANKSNVIFGKDLDYSIPTFYRVEYTPTAALYDKDGKLIDVMHTGITVDRIAKELNINLR